ncbi:hypothetical protein JNL27_06680 [bacterium]|nr:hypothetical protein [bacterium]
MKRFTAVTLIALMSLLVISSSSFAQIGLKFGPRVGTETKNGDLFAGAQVEASILMITLVPNVEYVFVKDAKQYNINLDGQYTVFGVGVAKLFAGAGYSMSIVDPDKVGLVDPKSDTFNGYNVQFGGKAGLGGFEVFALAKYMRIDGKGNQALVAGMNFGF